MAKKTTKKSKKTTEKPKRIVRKVEVRLVIPTKREGCRVDATEGLRLVIPTKRQGCYLGYEDC